MRELVAAGVGVLRLWHLWIEAALEGSVASSLSATAHSLISYQIREEIRCLYS
jgi:hypothetical protein